jgi:acid stress-induced BolA-like protein IbaG/YrbA
MASLKQKIESVFSNAASEIVDPIFDIEESPSHKVAGFIISNSFMNMDQIDRQNKVWDHLEQNLPPDDLSNIVSLLTVTPDEAEINTLN